MALIGKGIFGGFRGKVSNVEGSGWKGRDIVKGWSDRKGLVTTNAQDNQRGVMRVARYYAEGTKRIADALYVKKKNKNIGVWAFNTRTWLNASYANGSIDFLSLKWGTMVLDRRVFHPIYLGAGSFSYKLVVNSFPVAIYNGGDVVWSMLCYNQTQGYVTELGVFLNNTDQEIVYTDPRMLSGDSMYMLGISIVDGLGFQSEYGVNVVVVP